MTALDYLEAKLKQGEVSTELADSVKRCVEFLPLAPMEPVAHMLQGGGFALTWDNHVHFLSLDFMPGEDPEFYYVNRRTAANWLIPWPDGTSAPEGIPEILKEIKDYHEQATGQ